MLWTHVQSLESLDFGIRHAVALSLDWPARTTGWTQRGSPMSLGKRRRRLMGNAPVCLVRGWREFTYVCLLPSQAAWVLVDSKLTTSQTRCQEKVNLNLILNHWRFDVFCDFIQLRQTLAISPPNFYRWGYCGPREKAAFVGAAS